MGRLDLLLSSSTNWFCLYLVMNSTQDSTRVKSLLQLVSKIALTPNDLKNLVSFLKAWNIRSFTLNPGRSRVRYFASHIYFKDELRKNWKKLWARAKCHLDRRNAKMRCNRSPWLWRNRHNHCLSFINIGQKLIQTLLLQHNRLCWCDTSTVLPNKQIIIPYKTVTYTLTLSTMS